MIAKCSLISILVVFVSAHPRPTGFEFPNTDCDCQSQSSQIALVSSGSSSGPIIRNLIGKGKYPVALSSCGPRPDQQVPVTTSRYTAPAQEKPIVRLAAKIPAPKVISHTCTCYKTVVKPRVHQHIVTVPILHRYIETTHKPVFEKFEYEAEPVNCAVEPSAGAPKFVAVEAPVQAVQTTKTPEVQTIEIPRVQTVEVPRVQAVEVPRVQTVEVPRVQTFEVPRVQTVEVPRVQTFEVPRVQTLEVPRAQTVEVPRVQTVEVPRVQTFEVPRVQNVEVPQVQTVEVPQSFSFGSSAAVEIPQSFSFGAPSC